MMRHVLPKMPLESAELPQFFETVEKLYVMYKVPAEVQAKILIPLLTAQAKSLVKQMSIDDMSKYDELKEFLLTEYKLTPREYKIRFETAVKHADETYTLFAARLRNLLTYYLKNRLVEDYDTLIELLISDRLKGSLSQGLLNYILTQEGKGWYVVGMLVALLADVYVNNRATVIGQKAPEGKSAKVATAATSRGATAGQNSRGGRGGHYQAGRGGFGGLQSPTQAQKARCYTCGELEHLARDCPQEQKHSRGGYQGSFRKRYRVGHRGGSRGSSQGGGVRVNLMSTIGQSRVETRKMGVQYEDGGGQVTLINAQLSPFGEYPIVDTVNTVKSHPNVCIYSLKYVNVTVSGCDCVALEDSGCEIPLVSNRLFSWCCNETVGKVTLHGFGRDQTVCAPLVNLTVCLNDAECENVQKIPIVCVVTDLQSPDYDVNLPIDVVRDLQVAAGAISVSGCVGTDVCDVTTETEAPEVEGNTPEDVNSLPTRQVEADSVTLAPEQEQDPTLAPCWAQAQAGKGGFVIHKDLLYHKDQVDGQSVCQLCVPQGRRAQILRLAHESIWWPSWRT